MADGDSATQTGAAREVRAVRPGMEEINARRRAELLADGVPADALEKVDAAATAGDAAALADDDPAVVHVEDDTAATKQVTAQLGDLLDPTQYGAFKVKVKVDGEEREVPLSEVAASFQIQTAAAKRMNEATTTKQQADAALADANRLKEEAGAQLRQAQGDTSKKAAADAETANKAAKLKALFKQQGQALLEGDSERSADLAMEIEELRGASQPTAAAPSVEDLTKQIEPVIQQRIELQSAYKAFAGSYPEIVANEHLNDLSAKIYQDKIAEGKDMATAFTEAGNAVREHIKTLASDLGMVPKGQSTAVDTEKLGAKQAATAATTIPAAGGKSNLPEKPRTREENLAAEAKRRGQTFTPA